MGDVRLETRLAEVTAAKADVEKQLADAKVQHDETVAANSTLAKDVELTTAKVVAARAQRAEEAAAQLQIETKNAALEKELASLRANSSMTGAQQAAAVKQCKKRCDELRAAEQNLVSETAVAEQDAAGLESQLATAAGQVAELQAEADQHARVRRKLRSAVSMMKQNVRVAVCVSTEPPHSQ